MWINLLLGLNACTTLIVFLLLTWQFFIRSQIKNTITQQENYFLQLSKQNQNLEQQLREYLLQTLHQSIHQLQQDIIQKFNEAFIADTNHANDLKEKLQHAFTNHRERFDERQMETLKILQDTLQKGAQENRQQIKEFLADYANLLGKRVDQLTQTTEDKLKEINHQVEKRLVEGFEKTNATFADVMQRLTLIDAAQKKITELSSNVVSLQEILNDKRSRGAFGEIQLSALIHNMIPEQHFSFQHKLSNDRRPDCMLFLPEPTGNIAIDAKFPLENYRLLIDSSLPESTRQQAERQFKLDIRKHIQDIADKYIIPGETSDGAMMFIPAEAVFAEIHARHDDLVEMAQRAKVWLVSPTTMMAILTTARAVLKDAATRKQVHEIQKHLRILAEDFERFQIRMDNLAKRIAQAHNDVDLIHTSSRKISQRFVQIDRAELESFSPAVEQVDAIPVPSLISGQPTSLINKEDSIAQ